MVRRRRSVPEGGSVALLRVVDALPYGVLVADGNADAQQANRAWEQLTGQRGESWREHGWLLAAPADLRDRVRDDVLGDVRAGIAHVAEWTVRDPVGMDDETLAGGRVLELEVQPVFEAGALKWIVATAIDVTSQRDRVRQLVEQATRDPLTGLYNRGQFLEFVRHALDRQRRQPEQRSTVFFIDVDQLKSTNDSHGHAAGDRVLREAAAAIASAVRPSDVVARYGGDEFTVLSESIGDPVAAARVAARIRQHVSDVGVGASVSVGFAVADEPDADAASLISEADLSMYESRAVYGPRDSNRSRAAHPSAGGSSRAFDVVAVTAHELRTPLTTIIGFASTLRSNRDHMTPEAQDAAFDSLDRQANRLTDIVDQLLDLGRLRGTGMPPLARIDVRDAIADALDVAPPHEPVSVTLGWPSPELAVSGHRSSIARLVVNLLTNAYRHGGPQVLVDTVGHGDLVEIIVEDDGPGVPEDVEAGIFDPFVRGTGHGGSGPAGAGLGLAIAREIARSFGGDLVHERVEPHGARMRLTLPAARPRLRLAESLSKD